MRGNGTHGQRGTGRMSQFPSRLRHPTLVCWAWALLLSAHWSIVPCARAQVSPSVLQIIISIEGENQPTTRELNVLLLNEWGEVEAADTTRHGIVQFSTKSGLRRLRITGPEIEPFEDEFYIESSRLNRIPVQVQPREHLSAAPQQTPATVDTVRMKVPAKARKEYEKAQNDVKKQHFESARAHLQKAISLYPDFDMAYCGLGQLAMREGDRETARVNFEKAIHLNDNYAEPRRQLAGMLLSELDYGRAHPILLRLTQLEPSNPWALSSLALCYFALGRFDTAVLYARKVHALPHKAYAVAHLIAGNSLEALSKQQEAVDEYRRYLEEDPAGAQAEMARQALARLGRAPQSK